MLELGNFRTPLAPVGRLTEEDELGVPALHQRERFLHVGPVERIDRRTAGARDPRRNQARVGIRRRQRGETLPVDREIDRASHGRVGQSLRARVEHERLDGAEGWVEVPLMPGLRGCAPCAVPPRERRGRQEVVGIRRLIGERVVVLPVDDAQSARAGVHPVLHHERVQPVRPWPGVVRVLPDDLGEVADMRREGVRPCRGDRPVDAVRKSRRPERNRGEGVQGDARREVRRGLHERERERVAVHADAGDVGGFPVSVGVEADDVLDHVVALGAGVGDLRRDRALDRVAHHLCCDGRAGRRREPVALANVERVKCGRRSTPSVGRRPRVAASRRRAAPCPDTGAASRRSPAGGRTARGCSRARGRC